MRVPVREIRFPISKIADGEWCDQTEVAKTNKTVVAATKILPLKRASL